MKKNTPKTDIEELKTETLLPKPSVDGELNDTTIRLIGIPFFGLVIPNISGLIRLELYSFPEIVLGQLYFIFIAFCIWQGNRFLLFKLRRMYSWLNNPFQKIISLFMANLLYTVPLTIGLCWLWYTYLATDAINWNIITNVTLICVICVIFITHVYEMVFLAKNWEANKQTNEQLQITLNKYLIINTPPVTEDLALLEERPAAKTRILVKKGSDYTYLTAQQTAYFYTLDKIVFAINTQGERFMVDYTLTELESMLPRNEFYRVNRQYLINIIAIQKFRPSYKGKLLLKIVHCADEITISQETSNGFKQWIET
ncbi:MAG: LytTR family transcriptional regulator [Bacteroidetes bacterium]|nr:MAG: LytTR family transcriptional regulator [Bacteroidota bacterium]